MSISLHERRVSHPQTSLALHSRSMGFTDFKKRLAAHPSSRFSDKASSSIEAPSPTVPMDAKRAMRVHQEKSPFDNSRTAAIMNHSYQRGATQFLQSKPMDSVPNSPSWSNGRNSASGEPLFYHDFPTQSMPTKSRLPNNTEMQDFEASKDIRDPHSKRGVRMDLSQQEQESAHLRRSRGLAPVIVTPSKTRVVQNVSQAAEKVASRSTTPGSSQERRNSFPPHGASAPTHHQEVPPIPAIPVGRPDSDDWSSPDTDKSRLASSKHSNSSVISLETKASSVDSTGLPALQAKSALPDGEQLEPLLEDDPASFDLVLPQAGEAKSFQLEDRSELMFSREHLQEIFRDTNLLLQFTNFLSARRAKSIQLLVYYLDALKSLRAIKYANAVAESLVPIDGYNFSEQLINPTTNSILETRAKEAFDALVKDDLPAFIANTFIRVVSLSISRRIAGTLPPHLREASEGLAEVFCLTDPNRSDNPIIFASEEFHKTTQYGMNYVIGRNCRFLQGPHTNKHSVDRLRDAVREQREVSEVFLNYRRDGSPFMNLLMCAPLLDSRGNTRYFIGAQVDVSGLCKECTDLPGLKRLIAEQNRLKDKNKDEATVDLELEDEEKDCFQEMVEMFSETEINTVRQHGGKMHREQLDEEDEGGRRGDRPRLLIKEPSDPATSPRQATASLSVRNGRLEGVYQNYLLVRPYPSLRILFCSPSLRVPGILQSPFLDRIGGSARVRETLVAALADSRGVTAKIRWVSGRNSNGEGRPRWIHCTPLLGQNRAVGVWMVVLVEDDSSQPSRKFRQPPPVEAFIRARPSEQELFDPPMMPEGLGRRLSQDAGRRPRTGNSLGQESLESFTIEPA